MLGKLIHETPWSHDASLARFIPTWAFICLTVCCKCVASWLAPQTGYSWTAQVRILCWRPPEDALHVISKCMKCMRFNMTHAKMWVLPYFAFLQSLLRPWPSGTRKVSKNWDPAHSCALFINSPSAVLSLHALTLQIMSFSFLACFGRCQGQRPAIFLWSFCARNWRSWRGTSWVQSFSVTVSGLL